MNRTLFLGLAGLLLAGCATENLMSHYVPEHCNGATAPFASFTIRQESMPGFIEPVVGRALEGALQRQGLRLAPDGASADVTVVARFSMITRAPEAGSEDPFGDSVAPGPVSRFVAHVDLDLLDNRDGSLIWKGSMDRSHAILGGETFHDERAVLIVSHTLDNMLEGVMDPCS